MNISEVLDIEPSEQSDSKPLTAGLHLVVKGFDKHFVEKVGSECAEIETTDGKYYSFAKAVVGQASSEWWKDVVAKAVEKDASSGLDIWVVERVSNSSGRPMLALSAYEPKNTTIKVPA